MNDNQKPWQDEAVTLYPPALAPTPIRCLLGLHKWLYVDHVACGLRECSICGRRK